VPSFESNSIESLVKLSRRQLWAALGVIVALGIFAIAILTRLPLPANSFLTLLPVIVVIAVARRSPIKDAAWSDDALQAIRKDELRQASLALAYRNGFIALLSVQPLLAVGLTALSAPNLLALMVCLSVLTGSLVFLGTLLYYDR
jgi:hypothetical protein